MNANFTALENQILYLRDQVTALQSASGTHDQQITETSQHVTALEDSKVMALEDNLELLDVADPSDSSKIYPTVRFTGVNLQIVNGTGSTNGTPDGLGNLIIGYNGGFAGSVEFCSLGLYDNQYDCEDINGYKWAKNQRSGSHNLILGDGNSYTRDSGIIAGRNNIINRQQASVLGGFGNMASGTRSVISGGHSNQVTGDYASVSGGMGNTASGKYASVSGGSDNTASQTYSSISGGYRSVAGGEYASVSGGTDSYATGAGSWIGGGFGNSASGTGSSAMGGYVNKASGLRSTVTGGGANEASGQRSSVSGGNAIEANDSVEWCGGGTTSAPNCH